MIQDTETIDEFLAQHSADVEEAIRKAAATEIMPRFRQLAAHEIDQKARTRTTWSRTPTATPSCI